MLTEKYNLDYLHSISEGDEGFVLEMIQTFINTVPDELEKIYKLLNNKDWDMVGSEAHRFASNLVFLGLEKLRNTAIEIENICISKKNLEKIPALVDILKDVCNQNILYLKEDFAGKI